MLLVLSSLVWAVASTASRPWSQIVPLAKSFAELHCVVESSLSSLPTGSPLHASWNGLGVTYWAWVWFKDVRREGLNVHRDSQEGSIRVGRTGLWIRVCGCKSMLQCSPAVWHWTHHLSFLSFYIYERQVMGLVQMYTDGKCSNPNSNFDLPNLLFIHWKMFTEQVIVPDMGNICCHRAIKEEKA